MKNTSQELSGSKKSTEPSKEQSPAEQPTDKSTTEEKKKPIRVEICLMPTYKKPTKRRDLQMD